MRQSNAVLAWIARGQGNGFELLVQWNEAWQAFHLVGGHVHADESYRDCLIRELAEELNLAFDDDYSLVGDPLQRLEYTAWSERARAETAYRLEVFTVHLHPHAEQRVRANPSNRWVRLGELAAGVCDDGRRLSPTLEKFAALWSATEEPS